MDGRKFNLERGVSIPSTYSNNCRFFFRLSSKAFRVSRKLARMPVKYCKWYWIPPDRYSIGLFVSKIMMRRASWEIEDALEFRCLPNMYPASLYIRPSTLLQMGTRHISWHAYMSSLLGLRWPIALVRASDSRSEWRFWARVRFPLVNALSKVRDSQLIMYNHRSNHISLLSGYPEPSATQIRIRGLRPARDGYKLKKTNLIFCQMWKW